VRFDEAIAAIAIGVIPFTFFYYQNFGKNHFSQQVKIPDISVVSKKRNDSEIVVETQLLLLKKLIRLKPVCRRVDNGENEQKQNGILHMSFLKTRLLHDKTAMIAYRSENSGKKKNLPVLCCLLFSPYHKGDNNGGNSTNQRKSPENVGEKSNCNIG
jgi:hypothetical protein